MPARTPILTARDLTADQAELWHEFAALESPAKPGEPPLAFPIVRHDGGLNGPFNAMLLSPDLGRALQGVGGAIRNAQGLSDRIRERAILAVAATDDCDYIATAHAAVARSLGVDGEFHDEVERLAATVVSSLLESGDIGEADFRAAVDLLGLPALFELVTLVGYYRLLCVQLRVFSV